jgi:hypothetical protein
MMNSLYQMEDGNQREAQYWWAFTCLVLAGRRSAADFSGEFLRRSSGLYPTPQQVEKFVDEAISHLADVLNAGLVSHNLRTEDHLCKTITAKVLR